MPILLDCLGTPYIYNMVISIIFFIIYTALNAVTTAADFDLSPIASGVLSMVDSRVEVMISVGFSVDASLTPAFKSQCIIKQIYVGW